MTDHWKDVVRQAALDYQERPWCVYDADLVDAARAKDAAEIARLKRELCEQRLLGHAEGQEHTIADVNAGRIDDLIAPRLAAKEARWRSAEARERQLEAERDDLKVRLKKFVVEMSADLAKDAAEIAALKQYIARLEAELETEDI